MKNSRQKFGNHSGQALLVSVLLITFAAVSLGLSIAVSSSSEVSIRQNTQEKVRSYALAESGIEDALIQLVRDPNFNANYSLPVPSPSDTIGVTVLKDNPSPGQSSIISQGSSSGRKTSIKVEVSRENSKVTILTYNEID